MSGISNHDSPDLTREAIADLLEAVARKSDDALPDFRRWCEAHIDMIRAIALSPQPPLTPISGVLSFEEALVFVRMQLDALQAVRSTTGLDALGERRYNGLCATEVDLIVRTTDQE